MLRAYPVPSWTRRTGRPERMPLRVACQRFRIRNDTVQWNTKKQGDKMLECPLVPYLPVCARNLCPESGARTPVNMRAPSGVYGVGMAPNRRRARGDLTPPIQACYNDHMKVVKYTSYKKLNAHRITLCSLVSPTFPRYEILYEPFDSSANRW